VTGFRTLSEFYDHTNTYERTLILESMQAYANEQERASRSSGGGGMGGPPGL
jgi:hypothetical protein